MDNCGMQTNKKTRERTDIDRRSGGGREKRRREGQQARGTIGKKKGKMMMKEGSKGPSKSES